MDVGHHILASTTSVESQGRRSAVCNTARFSEVLMCSPASIASRRSSRCAAGRAQPERQRFAGDAVLAVVDVEVADRQREVSAAAWIVGEKSRR